MYRLAPINKSRSLSQENAHNVVEIRYMIKHAIEIKKRVLINKKVEGESRDDM